MGAVIYRPTDRIEIQFQGFSVWVSPLTLEQRGRLAALYQTVSGVDKSNALNVGMETLRFTVKQITGVVLSDDSPYELRFDNDGLLTPECAMELVNLDSSDRLVSVATRVGLGTYRYDDIAGFGELFKVVLDKPLSKKKKEETTTSAPPCVGSSTLSTPSAT